MKMKMKMKLEIEKKGVYRRFFRDSMLVPDFVLVEFCPDRLHTFRSAYNHTVMFISSK